VEHELLERVAPLRDDEEPVRGAARGEDFLDRAPTGDEFLVGPQQVGRRERGGRARPGCGLERRSGPRRWRGRRGTPVGRAA
jgi:hypothetical protein